MTLNADISQGAFGLVEFAGRWSGLAIRYVQGLVDFLFNWPGSPVDFFLTQFQPWESIIAGLHFTLSLLLDQLCHLWWMELTELCSHRHGLSA